MPRAPGNDITEIFGYVPDDLSTVARNAWVQHGCPFTGRDCIKHNRDRSVYTGVCSVTGPMEARSRKRDAVIICPNRLFAGNHAVLREAASDAFPGVPFLMHPQLQDLRLGGRVPQDSSVALGQGSGKEIQDAGCASPGKARERFHQCALPARKFTAVTPSRSRRQKSVEATIATG